MKRSIIVSAVFHALLLIALLSWRSESKRWLRKITPYSVELVSLAQIQAATAKDQPQNRIESKKQPENVIPVPEKRQTPVSKPKSAPVVDSVKTQKTASAGSPGLKVDALDFPFAYYLNILHYRVQSNWTAPYQTTQGQKPPSCIIGFRIFSNGNISDVVIKRSSGSYLFDQAARRAVYAASPLPPLPDSYDGEYLTVNIEFEGA